MGSLQEHITLKNNTPAWTKEEGKKIPVTTSCLILSGYLTMFSLLPSGPKKSNSQKKNLDEILREADTLTHVATGLLTLLALPAHLITTGLSYLPSDVGYFFYRIVRPGANINYYLKKRKDYKEITWDNSTGIYDYFLKKIRPSLMIASSGLSFIGGMTGATLVLMHSDLLFAAGHYLAAAGKCLATGHWDTLSQTQPTVGVESILITWLAVGLLINYISQAVMLYNKLKPPEKTQTSRL